MTTEQRSHNVDLVVIGLGYVGLPLALEACRSGLIVAGLDRNPRVIDGLGAGRSHVDDLSDDDVVEMLRSGFRATADASVISRASAVVICVPTPLTEARGPDLGPVLGAADAVAAHLRPGTLVVLESTTYPGTTEELLVPRLEATGLRLGVDFHVAFSPERIDPGNPFFRFRNTPKVVGGVTPACRERAAAFYGGLVDKVVEAKGTREAELAKLLENTYRHVNIALLNEMVRFCHELGIDLWDVIACASSKPFGFQAFYPGPGVGGHCIPIDPNYLSHRVQAKLGYTFRFVELAQEINNGMPGYVVHRVQDLLNERGLALSESRVLLLGVTYKPDIADQRESPAVPVARGLLARGARVTFHDPYVPIWTALGEDARRVDDLDAALGAADVVVLLQRHAAYDVHAVAEQARQVLDTRGVLPEVPGVERL
jgi:UDP-N-acetyl-D-glucosamine dehydrogenase